MDINNIINTKPINIQIIGNYTRKTYEIKTVYSYTFDIFNGSFGNCQNLTINRFGNIINNITTYESLKCILEYLTNSKEFIGRKIIVADICKSKFEKLINIINSEEIINRIFIMKNEYTSTNNSQMVLIMINVKNL